jgi:hypothetical protein
MMYVPTLELLELFSILVTVLYMISRPEFVWRCGDGHGAFPPSFEGGLPKKMAMCQEVGQPERRLSLILHRMD